VTLDPTGQRPEEIPQWRYGENDKLISPAKVLILPAAVRRPGLARPLLTKGRIEEG